MNKIRHDETSIDSLFKDVEQNLETIFHLWMDGNVSLRFSVAILCAVKLEAFINAAGKLKMDHWDILERKLSFVEKCNMVFSTAGLIFDPDAEPNKTAVTIFEIRNSLVHPKTKLVRIDEHISQEEYEQRSNNLPAILHHLRSELSKEKITRIKEAVDEFVNQWGNSLLDGNPNNWLNGGSTGGFTLVPEKG
jgi:hypothetical protein